MKVFITLATLVLAMVTANADIIRPGNIATRTYTGKKAEKMYNAQGGQVLMGDSLRTRTSSYKVWRSDDGLKQTICEKISYFAPTGGLTEYRCTVQKSNDGAEVPVFNPPRRLG
jgi:hypothetical protein